MEKYDTDQAQDILCQISRAKKEWESTADTLADLVCLIDREGRILRANRTVERWRLGQVKTVKGRNLHDLLHPGCTDLQCSLKAIWDRAWQKVRRGSEVENEIYVEALKRHLRITVKPLSSAPVSGAAFAVAAVADNTREKQAEILLRQARDALEKRVTERTTELALANRRLKAEVVTRERAAAEIAAKNKLLEEQAKSLEELTNELFRQNDWAVTLGRTSSSLQKSTVEEVADVVKRGLWEDLGVENFGVFLINRERETIESKAIVGASEKGITLSVQDELIATLINGGRIVSRESYPAGYRVFDERFGQWMLLPFKGRSGVLGFVVVNSSGIDDMDAVQIYINQAAMAMENAILFRQYIRSTFSRYVPDHVVDIILDRKLQLGGEEKTVSVLFSDIRGFTAMAEEFRPVEVVHFLNRYMTLMTDAVFEYEGTLDKFIGDAIMAIFGAPISGGVADDAKRAVFAALKMREKLEEMNRSRTRKGQKSIKIGIGIHTGEVVAGNIGSERRMEYTVIGDTVNLCSRIETLNKEFGTDILISRRTYDLTKKYLKAREIPDVEVRGKREPATIYAVIGELEPC